MMNPYDAPVQVSITCWQCGEKQDVIEITHGQLKLWRDGAKIQQAFPELTPDVRELLISATCSTCFDKMFADAE